MAEGTSLMAEISIIIRAKDEGRYLQECIDRIREQSEKDLEIVCVYDIRSTDDTLQIAEKNGLIICKVGEDGFSFGEAINVGIRGSSGRYLVFVSAHAIPANQEWLRELVSPLRTESSLAGTFSRQIPANDAYQFWGRVLLKPFPKDKAQGTVLFSNVSSAIKREVWEKYPFNPTLTGSEDYAWAREVTKNGYETKYCPRSIIHHSHNESFSQIKNREYREILALFRINALSSSPIFLLKRLIVCIKNIFLDLLYFLTGQENLFTLKKAITYRVGVFLGDLKGYREFSRGE